jgi:MoaA/NifB/PqqE/SkfB family radical SAM enzyme
MAVLLTNGFLLNKDRIRRLNRAGLDYLQISIDNLEPDATST